MVEKFRQGRRPIWIDAGHLGANVGQYAPANGGSETATELNHAKSTQHRHIRLPPICQKRCTEMRLLTNRKVSFLVGTPIIPSPYDVRAAGAGNRQRIHLVASEGHHGVGSCNEKTYLSSGMI